MARKRIKLEEQAMSEILIADTDLESGDEAGNVEEYFAERGGEGEEEEGNNNNKSPNKSNHRLQQVADYQPGDWLKEHKHPSFCWSSKRYRKK
jgi:hypothetical protein